MQIEIENTSFELEQIPRKCPICHFEAEPEQKSGTVINYHKIDVAFHCTNCHHMFIGKYIKQSSDKYKLVDTWPKTLQNINFEIKDISPTFVRLYEESICAYDSELKQIAGLGLRKSLEILLKDFLIYKNNDSSKNIKAYSLLECVNKFDINHNIVDVSVVEKCSKREESYHISFEDKDIVKIKTLINTISNSIRNQLLENK